MKNELEIHVNARTVRRRLDERGIFGRIARHSHDFTPAELQKSIAFAEGYQHWEENDWDLVLFSDETHFDQFSHAQRWVQRPRGEAYNPAYVLTGLHPMQSIGLWGCFSGRGIGSAEIYTDKLDSQRYTSILQANLLPTARQFYHHGRSIERWYFQQDNAPQHHSNHTREWLHNNGIIPIDFPPYSPDLNPIENLWHCLNQRVFDHFPHTCAELEAAIRVEWEAMPLNLLTTIAHSMPKRIKAVIANRGHITTDPDS